MTQNQIAFFKAKEEQRHDIVSEGETNRHNYADESIRSEMNTINQQSYLMSNLESIRSHRAQEKLEGKAQKIRKAELKEAKRTHKRNESISHFVALENQRHNLATEGIDWANVGIGRMNAASNRQNAASNWQNALSNMANATTEQGRLQLDQSKWETNKWSTIETTSAQKDKLNAETRLAKAREQQQLKETQWYDTNQVVNNVSSFAGAGAQVGRAYNDAKNKPKQFKTYIPK